MATRSAAMNVMQAAAKKASRGLLRDYGEVDQLQVSRKGPADYVTAADRRCDTMLREELAKAGRGPAALGPDDQVVGQRPEVGRGQTPAAQGARSVPPEHGRRLHTASVRGRSPPSSESSEV